jgi:hypothetical protein
VVLFEAWAFEGPVYAMSLYVVEDERGSHPRRTSSAPALILGIYAMQEQNTSGVGAVLEAHGLAFLPEAHCYLRAGGERLDLTRTAARAEPIAAFLLEEEITPEQIGRYKVELHRGFLRRWAAEQGHDFESVWQVRERCIEALSRAPAP